MPDWTAFAGLTGVVLALLLALSRLTASALTDSTSDARDPASSVDAPSESGAKSDGSRAADGNRSTPIDTAGLEGTDTEPVGIERSADADPVDAERVDADSADAERASSNRANADAPTDRDGENAPATSEANSHEEGDRLTADSMATSEVLVNVAFSQGLFAAVLIAAAVYTEIPPDALGIAFERSALIDGLWIGVAFGLALYGVNELGSLAAKRLGIDHDEELRALLAPDSAAGWAVLLGIVLPTIAVFEEFLFRAAAVGAVSTGFAVSPWLLAVLSSIAFAVGHGVQGPTGVVVTGALGFVLAAAFIVTGSLLVVVVAHYLVNALEFAVHEGLGFEWETTDT